MLGTALMAMILQPSSTNCYPTGLGAVHCDTSPAPQAQPYQQRGFSTNNALGAFQQGREMRRQEEAAQRPPSGYAIESPQARTTIHLSPEETHQIFVQFLSERLAVLITAQRCTDAFNLAMLAGETGMANVSVRYCPLP